ncbi:hypothetical protein HYT52_04530 [Candidatus Woesearchaeota archaeon]|nr:hypothetical protein [Candidatus Woesearchaeota archaeon]
MAGCEKISSGNQDGEGILPDTSDIKEINDPVEPSDLVGEESSGVADVTNVTNDSLQNNLSLPLEEVAIVPSETIVSQTALETMAKVHTVEFNQSGFVPTKLTIKVGDSILWKNSRDKVKAMVLGSQACAKVKSEILNPGQTFQWTFTEPLRCPIVDGIYVTAVMNIVVE